MDRPRSGQRLLVSREWGVRMVSCVDNLVFTVLSLVIAALAFAGWAASLVLAFPAPEEKED
jgi:hypothetical protein